MRGQRYRAGGEADPPPPPTKGWGTRLPRAGANGRRRLLRPHKGAARALDPPPPLKQVARPSTGGRAARVAPRCFQPHLSGLE